MKACLEKARDMSGWDEMAAKMLERNFEEQNGKLVGLEESLVQLLLASGAELVLVEALPDNCSCIPFINKVECLQQLELARQIALLTGAVPPPRIPL